MIDRPREAQLLSERMGAVSALLRIVSTDYGVVVARYDLSGQGWNARELKKQADRLAESCESFCEMVDRSPVPL